MGVIREHFDKVALLALTVLFLGMLLDLIKFHPDSAAISWAEKSLDVILGSLLTLITGQAFRAGTTTVTVPPETKK